MRIRQSISTFIFAAVVMLVTSPTTRAQGPNSNVDSPGAAVQRAAAAHGKVAGTDPADSVADGRVTLHTLDGPKVTLDITIMRKGTRAVQRVIKQQPVTLKRRTPTGKRQSTRLMQRRHL